MQGVGSDLPRLIDLDSIPKFQETPITIIPKYVFENCNQVTCNQYQRDYLTALREKVKNPASFKLEKYKKEKRVKKEEELDWVYGLDYLEKTYLQDPSFIENPSKAFTVPDLIKINGLFSRLCNDRPGEFRDKPIRWQKKEFSPNESVIVNKLEPIICSTAGMGPEWFASISDPLAQPNEPALEGSVLQLMRGTLKKYKDHPEALRLRTPEELEWLEKDPIDPGIVDEWAEMYCVDGKFSLIRWLKDRLHFFPVPSKIQEELQKTLDSIAEPQMHPIEKACRIWLDFVKIHPSHEANKRTGKGLGSIIFLPYGYLPPKIGKADSEEYVKILEESFERIDGCARFTQFIARKIIETQEEYRSKSIAEI